MVSMGKPRFDLQMGHAHARQELQKAGYSKRKI